MPTPSGAGASVNTGAADQNAQPTELARGHEPKNTELELTGQSSTATDVTNGVTPGSPDFRSSPPPPVARDETPIPDEVQQSAERNPQLYEERTSKVKQLTNNNITVIKTQWPNSDLVEMVPYRLRPKRGSKRDESKQDWSLPFLYELAKVAKMTGQRGGEVMTACEPIFDTCRKSLAQTRTRGSITSCSAISKLCCLCSLQEVSITEPKSWPISSQIMKPRTGRRADLVP